MLIKVKTFPGAKVESITEKATDQFEVTVREQPVRGLATRATARLLAEYFHVTVGQVRLVKGARERNKIFEILTKAGSK